MLDALRRVFRLAAGRSTAAEDLDEELRLHLDLRIQELVEQGLPLEAARLEARRAFGDLARVRSVVGDIDRGGEQARRRMEFWDELWRDLRVAFRSLRRNPGFALVAVLTLALGIGATVAMFTVVNGVLLRRLPYPNAERVVLLWTRPKDQPAVQWPFSVGNYLDFARATRTLERTSALRAWSASLSDEGGGEPEAVSAARVTPGFFQVLGVRPLLGREFDSLDAAPGAARVVVLSHALWHRRFGGRADIVSRMLSVSGERYTVLGVLPAGFHFPRGAELPSGLQFPTGTDLWTPLVFAPDEIANRGTQNLAVVGLRRPGVPVGQVQADLERFWRPLQRQFRAFARMEVLALGMSEQSARPVRRVLLVLLGAVGFLLLIACANVSNLLLARCAARTREVAIRAALGAGPRRVARTFLVENLVLTTAGAGLGVALTLWGRGLLLRLVPRNLPRLDDIVLDWRVLGFTVGLVLAAALGFGLVAAAHAMRSDLARELHQGSARSTGGGRAQRVRQVLIVGEVAISLVLLSGATVLGLSFLRLHAVAPGFDPRGVLTVQIQKPVSQFVDPARAGPEWARFYHALEDRLAARPGVVAAGAVSPLPLSGAWESSDIVIEGRTTESGPRPSAYDAAASDGYFRALRIPLLEGRTFGPQDRRDSADVAVVSRSLARAFWPGQSAVRKRVRLFWPRWLEIVGVVGDVHQDALETPAPPTIYVPISLYQIPFMTLTVRGAGDPHPLLPVVRSEVRALDPLTVLVDPRSMEEVMTDSLAQRRFSLVLLGFFAVSALVLAVLGLYGVIAYAVAGRSPELGVRLALGAKPSQLLVLVLRQGVRLGAIGVALGLAGAVALGRVLSSLVFQTNPLDPASLAAVGGLLLLVAVAASLAPARRAMRVDPVVTLRAE